MIIQNPFYLFKKTFVYFLLPGFLFASCSGEKKPKPKENTSNKIVLKQSFKDKMSYKATDDYKLLENSCLYCHKLGASKEKEVAPQMLVVRDIYKQSYPTKEDFVNAMAKFTANPNEDTSLMQSAVEQFGLMENSGISLDDAKEIAYYLYDFMAQ